MSEQEKSKIDPQHYISHSVMIQPIELCEKLPFCVGNAVKYIIRAGSKDGESERDDLLKARWYLMRSMDNGDTITLDHVATFIADRFAQAKPALGILFGTTPQCEEWPLRKRLYRVLDILSERIRQIETDEFIASLRNKNLNN